MPPLKNRQLRSRQDVLPRQGDKSDDEDDHELQDDVPSGTLAGKYRSVARKTRWRTRPPLAAVADSDDESEEALHANDDHPTERPLKHRAPGQDTPVSGPKQNTTRTKRGREGVQERVDPTVRSDDESGESLEVGADNPRDRPPKNRTSTPANPVCDPKRLAHVGPTSSGSTPDSGTQSQILTAARTTVTVTFGLAHTAGVISDTDRKYCMRRPAPRSAFHAVAGWERKTTAAGHDVATCKIAVVVMTREYMANVVSVDFNKRFGGWATFTNLITLNKMQREQYVTLLQDYGDIPTDVYDVTPLTAVTFTEATDLPLSMVRVGPPKSPLCLVPVVENHHDRVSDSYLSAGTKRTLLVTLVRHGKKEGASAIDYYDAYVLGHRPNSGFAVGPLTDVDIGRIELVVGSSQTLHAPTGMVNHLERAMTDGSPLLITGAVLTRREDVPTTAKTTIWLLGQVVTKLSPKNPLTQPMRDLVAFRGPMLAGEHEAPTATAWDDRNPVLAVHDGRTYTGVEISFVPTDNPKVPFVQHPVLPVLLRRVDDPDQIPACIVANAVVDQLEDVAQFLAGPLSECEPEEVSAACSAATSAMIADVTLQIKSGVCVVQALANVRSVV